MSIKERMTGSIKRISKKILVALGVVNATGIDSARIVQAACCEGVKTSIGLKCQTNRPQ